MRGVCCRLDFVIFCFIYFNSSLFFSVYILFFSLVYIFCLWMYFNSNERDPIAVPLWIIYFILALVEREKNVLIVILSSLATRRVLQTHTRKHFQCIQTETTTVCSHSVVYFFFCYFVSLVYYSWFFSLLFLKYLTHGTRYECENNCLQHQATTTIILWRFLLDTLFFLSLFL